MKRSKQLPDSHRPYSNRKKSDAGAFTLYDSIGAKLKINGDEDRAVFASGAGVRMDGK